MRTVFLVYFDTDSRLYECSPGINTQLGEVKDTGRYYFAGFMRRRDAREFCNRENALHVRAMASAGFNLRHK